MRGGAHAALGAAAAIPLALLTGPRFLIPVVLAGAVGGLLPDIDHPGSTLGRFVPWPAVVVENHKTGFIAHGRRWFHGRTVRHRGETHSVGAAAITAVATPAVLWFPLWRLVAWMADVRGMQWVAAHRSLWIFAVVTSMLAGCAVLVGYLTHLAADVPSPSPQMLLWPISRRMLRPKWVPRVPERSLAGHLLEAAVTLVAASFALVAWGARPV